MQKIDLQAISHEEAVAAAVTCLEQGGLLLFPTETTYGAGVDATNPAAVQKLLAYKSRRQGKPLSIAVTDLAMAEQYVDVNEQAQSLYARFLPGPVTVVSQDKGVVAPGVASEFGTVGVRIPDYQLVLDMVRALGRPITATSANASGKKRPYSLADVMAGISHKQQDLIDLVLDAGTLPPNEPSTVIDTTMSTPITLRERPSSHQAQHEYELISHSEDETKKIAGTLMLKNWDQLLKKGLIIALDGPLGAGKTIFTKGIAEFLRISETLTSPTYTYLEEYDWTRHGSSGHLYHLDLWKVDTAEQLARLEIESLLGPGNCVVIEWWQNVAGLTKLQPDLIIQVEDHHQTRRLLIAS